MKIKKKRKKQKPWRPLVQSAFHKDPKQNAALMSLLNCHEVWVNNLYQVVVLYRKSGITHLSIKRLDKQPIHDWRHLQQIKNQLCGPEYEAVELYPAESRRVDTTNQYHLWVMPEQKRFPFGFGSRFVDDGTDKLKGSKQRGDELADDLMPDPTQSAVSWASEQLAEKIKQGWISEPLEAAEEFNKRQREIMKAIDAKERKKAIQLLEQMQQWLQKLT